MRPVVLVAPSGPEERGATTAPALQLLGGSRLVDRLLGTLAEVCPPPAVVVAPSAIAVRLEGTLPHGAMLVPRDGSRRDQILAALDACDEQALLLHDAEEHFVGPDPGPVFGGDPLLTMAWLGAAGMPVLLLVLVVAWPSAPRALYQAAGLAFVLGVAVLLWRMPHRRDGSDDDTGAVV